MELIAANECIGIAMRETGIPDVLLRLVISVHEGARTRERVDTVLSEVSEFEIFLHNGPVLSPFLFCAGVKRVAGEFSGNYAGTKCEGKIGDSGTGR